MPLLQRFLPSVISAAEVYRRTAASCEIVVVDDGGTDHTDAWMTDVASCTAAVPVRLVRQDSNQGFGAAVNLGVRQAVHRLVFLLNNDVDVDPHAIGPLASRFEDTPGLFGVHCRVLDFSTGDEVGTGKMGGFSRGFLRVHRSYVTRGAAAGPRYSMFASGGSAMFDRQLFLTLGGFDPLFAPFYFEDVELSYRAWKRGFTVAYEPQSVVRHQFSSTIAPLAGRKVHQIGHRNRFLLHWIHLHDTRLCVSHALWVVVLLLSSAAKPAIAIGFVSALRCLRVVQRRRSEEKRAATRTDGEILALFKNLSRRSDIRAYDDPSELVERVHSTS